MTNTSTVYHCRFARRGYFLGLDRVCHSRLARRRFNRRYGATHRLDYRRGVLVLTVVASWLALAVLAPPMMAQEPTSPAPEACALPMTSWGAPLAPCGVGQTCGNLFGDRLEVLHVAGRQAYVRDLDRRVCRFAPEPRADVVYAAAREFRTADCLVPAWRLAPSAPRPRP